MVLRIISFKPSKKKKKTKTYSELFQKIEIKENVSLYFSAHSHDTIFL